MSPLNKLAETIAKLDESSKLLLDNMQDQVSAIIFSDSKRIEALSEKQAEMFGDFQKQEKEFIGELIKLMGPTPEEEELRLTSLKAKFPEFSAEIDEWQRMLTQNTRRLKQKHEQVLQLLKFAMERNARMMHSLYSMHNEKNTRYVANGERSDMMTGVAVNQEA